MNFPVKPLDIAHHAFFIHSILHRGTDHGDRRVANRFNYDSFARELQSSLLFFGFVFITYLIGKFYFSYCPSFCEPTDCGISYTQSAQLLQSLNKFVASTIHNAFHNNNAVVIDPLVSGKVGLTNVFFY